MNINWLYQEISGALSAFMYTWFFTFIGIGVLGLIIGIVIVVALEYRKMFERPNPFWGFLAKLNYIYTPVCFAALFGLVGAIYGIQAQADRWIDYSVEPIIASGKEMLPVLHTIAPRLDASADLDDAVYRLMEDGYQGSYVEKKILSFVINHYSYMVLHGLDYPRTVSGLRQLARDHQLEESDSQLLQQLPGAFKSYYGIFFNGLYKKAVLDLLPYLLIPVAEFMLFFSLFKAKRKQQPVAVNNYRIAEESAYV